MREFEGELEVQDVTQLFSNSDLKIRRGLTNWKVMIENKNDESKLIEIKGKDDLLLKYYKHIIL